MATTSIKLTNKTEPITLTENAQKKVAELIAKERRETESELYLRFSVVSGGCSGFSYSIYFDTEKEDDDFVKDYGDFKVLVASDIIDLIKGSTLDYSDDLSNAGFHVTNPNATRSCGCGQSFS